jgi:hypothetical protein
VEPVQLQGKESCLQKQAKFKDAGITPPQQLRSEQFPMGLSGIAGLDLCKILYKKQSGTQREKKHVLTLTLMLVRRKSACKTSAGSSEILRWLTPFLGPNMDPKMGSRIGSHFHSFF